MARKKISLAGKYAVSLILVLMVFLPLLVTIISSLKIPPPLADMRIFSCQKQNTPS